MPYLYQFGSEDKFTNIMKTHPQYEVVMFSGSAYINNRRFEGSDVPSGSLSLYELNVDRTSRGFATIYPYMIKGESFWTFYNVTTTAFNDATPGTILSGTLPATASVQREVIVATALPSITAGSTDAYVSARKRMIALRNTLDYYRDLSNKYHYTGDFVTGDVNMLSIPSIFYDSGIKKGSVSLKFYFSGTLMDEATDERQNGELLSTMGATSGSTVGVVLYNEGFVLLTSSITIDANNWDLYEFDHVLRQPSWKYFGAYTGSSTPPSSSVYSLSFRGTNAVPALTLFATVQPGQLNNSQNPTWISSSNGAWRDTTISTSGTYLEPESMPLTNTVQSQYCRFDDEFKKQVFISKIGLYDDEKNLIGLAKLANPVLTTEEDSFTFKLKMDF